MIVLTQYANLSILQLLFLKTIHFQSRVLKLYNNIKILFSYTYVVLKFQKSLYYIQFYIDIF